MISVVPWLVPNVKPNVHLFTPLQMRTHYCIHMGDCLNPAFILITDKLSVFACACLASTKQNLMHLMHFVGFQLTRFHENENGLASCPEAQKQTRSKAGKPVLRQSAQLMIMVLNWHKCIFRQVAGQRQHAIKISTQVSLNICMCVKAHQTHLPLSCTAAVIAFQTMSIHTKSAYAC